MADNNINFPSWVSEKTSLDSGDFLLISDSADSFNRKKAGISAVRWWNTVTVWTTWSWADYICDWVADEVQIQEAITYLNTLWGWTIRFLSWTYVIWSITMVDHIHMVWDSTVIIQAKASLDSYMFDLFDVTDSVSFVWITFDGNSSNQTYSTAVDIIWRRTTSTPTKRNIRVENCVFKNVTYFAINADNRKYNCYIINNDIQETMYTGIRIHSNEWTQVMGNTINCEWALFCGIFVDSRNNHISNNTITVDWGAIGIRFENDWVFAVSYNTVSDNTILWSWTRAGYGISLVWSNIKYNTFAGNTFKNLVAGYHQLSISNIVNGWACYDCTYWVVLASVDSINVISWLLVAGSTNWIYNNSGTKTIVNNCIFTTCGYWYREVNSADYTNLDGNIFNTITTTAITVLWAWTIQSNNLIV